MSETMIAIYVFTLACLVGYHVIWGVTPALHTPLMAVTNASNSVWIQMLGFSAVVLASINIFGGFVVTNRILAMFKKRS